MSTELVEKVEMAAGQCPVRGCEGGLDYGAFSPEDAGGYYPWRCMSCGATGQEWYDMSFSEHLLTGEPKAHSAEDKLERCAKHGDVMRQAERDREDARRYRELMGRLRELAHDLRSVFSRAELKVYPARAVLELAKGVR